MSVLPFPIEDRYYRFSRYLRQQFGERVYRISLDAGFSCPTRDGHLGAGGCLYCNNSSFSRDRLKNLPPVKTQLIQGIEIAREKHKADKFLAYFQAYTNTYGSINELENLYRSVLNVPDVVGILIGTRPDCVDNNILALLNDLRQETYLSVEYGIESVYDKTLDWARRGHSFETSIQTIEKTKNMGIHVGGHIIFGFPTESWIEILDSAAVLNEMELDALKIHHLHIVKNSALSNLYKTAPFPLFSETEWIILMSDFLERLNPNIVIQRLAGDARPGTLIAPQWTMKKTQILQEIQSELERRQTHQGCRLADDK
ncbi:MAG: TIGR01212 family radical SAM protein [Candidatus Marinimicrobia bacterium]|nr:TIGR01212 family radical SAM protein [Candidatus Neomarinimicrobiota bacterium]